MYIAGYVSSIDCILKSKLNPVHAIHFQNTNICTHTLITCMNRSTGCVAVVVSEIQPVLQVVSW